MVDNLVVISYWSERDIEPLKKLVVQINEINAGTIFDVLIVCNGQSQEVNYLLEQLTLFYKFRVIQRENVGFNIGAWDYGWRQSPNYTNFLFLQDDCIIFNTNWLKAFTDKFYADPNIGLLGESLSWPIAWDELSSSEINRYYREHTIDGQKLRRIDLYRAYLVQNSIPEGPKADHLQSLILFTSQEILQEIQGFSIGISYGEAVASEIAISKKVQAAGYTIDMVDPLSYFHYIGHPQWIKRRRKIQRILYWIRSKLLSKN